MFFHLFLWIILKLEVLKILEKILLEKDILNSHASGSLNSLAHFLRNIVFKLFGPIALLFLNCLITEMNLSLLVGSIIIEFSTLSIR